jgi:hypothetical protein
MARVSYGRELLSWSLLPLMLSGLQGGTMAVFVKKTFVDIEGISVAQLNFAVGIVAASKAIGHLSSFFWASASHGKPKIRFLMWLQIFTAIVIGLMALAPRTVIGLWSVTGLCILAWMIWSGVMTLRTGVWRANYHHSYRARVAGKLATIDALTIALAGTIIGFSLDWDPRAYRILFPLLAVAGALGALAYRRVPFRRHRQHLDAERRTCVTKRPSLNPLVIAGVLAADAPFRAYMACMFALGLGNLMAYPLLAIVLTDQFSAGYGTSIAITTVIPLICVTLAIPFWSRRLERMHVTRFRAVHAWIFVSASTLMVLGVASHQIALLYLAAVATGIGWGGGVLAWNLGHQHFAPRARDAEYMSVHITLTGIRGFLGPLIAVQAYSWLAPSGWQAGAFAICLLVNVVGAIGFVIVAARMGPDDSRRGVTTVTTDERLKRPDLALSTVD